MQDVKVSLLGKMHWCLKHGDACNKSLAPKKYPDLFVRFQRYSAGLMTLAVCIVLVVLVRGPPMRRTVMVSEWDVLSDNSPVMPKARAANARTQVCKIFTMLAGHNRMAGFGYEVVYGRKFSIADESKWQHDILTPFPCHFL
jgi:hypothetical protein